MLSPTNSTLKTAPVPPQDSSKPVLIFEEPQNQLLQKVARTALAVLLVVVTLGLILLFYSFSDLQSFPWCCQTHPSTKEQPTISIPVPLPSPPLAVPRPSTPPPPVISRPSTPSAPKPSTPPPLLPKAPKPVKTQEDLLPLVPEQVFVEMYEDMARRQTIEALVPAWDSDIIFKCLCYFHTLYPGLIPLETFPPATIFNFKQKIISILEDKKAVLRGEPIKGPLPICCSKENYRRHLQRTTLLPVFMWYHPTPKTLSDTMQTMKQLAIKGSVGASHWLLVIVDIQARRLVYFDSLYNYVMPPENMKKELQSFAQQLDQVYPAYDSKKFSVKIAAKEVIQRGSGSSCGAWCCQFLHWYLKDPLTDALNDLPVDSVERHENLASFVQACEAAVQDLPELSWPEA
ncbi:Ulp1 family isopeptidase [Chlamydia trachomatis]|uniref:Deubiquitinase and deneddylase Dub1 n=1 Tax=Chlamydia trachomatis TaxID=813 RepID=K0GC10_CHLTH|nr:Ulp1 family isopeptidase [Chlamydia trachomatis]AFU24075.1 membrane thiol protease [Chlamydia trachomatis]CCP67368.1 hypothetical protein L3404_00926 [Chlamydia trachomatis L3/404/LN]